MANGRREGRTNKIICDCDVKRQLPEFFAAHGMGGRALFVSGDFRFIFSKIEVISARLKFSTRWWVSVNNTERVTRATQASQDLFSFSTLIYSRCARCITKIPEDNENCQKMCRRREFFLPQFPSATSDVWEEWREKPWERVSGFLPSLCVEVRLNPASWWI